MSSRWVLWSFALILSLGCASKRQALRSSPIDQQSQPPAMATGGEKAAPALASQAVLEQILLKLKRVHFGLDSVTLHPEVRVALAEVAEQLLKYPQIVLIIEGHADDRGTTEYNLSLSERRAQAVSSFLNRAGVPAERLQIRAKGEEVPVDTRAGELSWALNRRVDFRIQQGEAVLELSEGLLLDDAGNPIPPLVGLEGASPSEVGLVGTPGGFHVAGFFQKKASPVR